jgi:hypothetical protein
VAETMEERNRMGRTPSVKRERTSRISHHPFCPSVCIRLLSAAECGYGDGGRQIKRLA